MDIETVAAETLLAGRAGWVDADLAGRLGHHPLDSIDTEFPHFVREMASPEGPDRPKDRHPVFYGCYDWHSAVHSHWALVRQLRIFDDHPSREEIVDRIDARFTDGRMAREVEHFAANPAFEKPYGWAWLLHLAAELSRWDADPAEGWRSVLEPLERRIVDRVETEFLTIDRPFRVGTHANTAFALHCVLDYAQTVGRDDLAEGVEETARACFADDRDYPVGYEPLGWDFLSPALAEADLMRRVYEPTEFRNWLDGFLPDLTVDRHASILEPIDVEADPDEGIALHFVGLNVQRAWAMAGVADALGGGETAERLERAAARHAEEGLAVAFTDEYAGAHWLSSFVLYLLTRNEGGIAPA